MIDVEKMRQKILDLAIRGKLVPQDPNEEPASALLERIRAEQEKLYKEGKIKKLPDFSYIYRGSDNRYYEKRGVFEKDFDVPVNWAIIKLSSIGTFGGGKTPSTGNPSFWGNEVNWTTSKDVKTKYIFESQTRLTKKGAEELQIYPINTLVLVTRSGILRHTVPISILSSPSTVNQDIKTISLGSSYLSEWIYLFFKANERKILSTCSKDGTTVESLDFDKIKNLQIPIAPKEQIGRIIGSVDEAFKILDTIYAAQKELDSFSILLKKKVLNSIFSSDKSYYTRQLSEVAQITMGQSVPSEKMHSHKNANDMEFHQGKTF
ncbi:MAG: restriction endonuclease subunit S, partial [Bacilli bacterium]|nr:restriction endonuclease subunit S [Bacilli bacterium]